VYDSDPEQVWVNGAKPRSSWTYIDLDQTAKNRFELPLLRIEYARTHPDILVCMSVKALFNEVTLQYDSMYYEDIEDRYALVSYCTHPSDHPSEVTARFSQNSVATLDEFTAALAQPFVIKLNQRLLGEALQTR
jgi:hypothetical protein